MPENFEPYLGIHTGQEIDEAVTKVLSGDLDVHGLPAGGGAGQVLQKSSDADFDAAWADAPQGTGGGVGQSMAGKQVEPAQGETVTAGEGAEIFNDYAARTFGAEEGQTEIVAKSGNVASGKYAHAENSLTTASGDYSHAEGGGTVASGGCAHAEGWRYIGSPPTTASGNGSHAEGFSTAATNVGAHAEGRNSEASGYWSHAEGENTVASGDKSHAEGYSCQATGDSAHAEGNATKGDGTASHAEGYSTIATGEGAHAEGTHTYASGDGAHAEGGVVFAFNSELGISVSSLASGSGSHAEGTLTVASGVFSHAEGDSAKAQGRASHAGGIGTIASANYQTAIGQRNVESSQESDRLIVGKGTTPTSRANCFRVTDTGTYASGNYNASGADYAEFFQWADGNPQGEDRAGRFVTLDGDRIRLTGPKDGYILGIISGNPSVVGDVYDDQWRGMFVTDVFGRPVWEEVELPEETVQVPDTENPEKEKTLTISPARVVRRQKLNPEYDPAKAYVPRSQRPEWDPVGLLGKLVAVDDGSCKIGGWCAPGPEGIGRKSADPTGYRVMARLDETHVLVMAR